MHTKPVLSAFQFRQEQNGPISDQVWAATSNSMDVVRPLEAEMYRPSGDHRGAYMPELPGMDVAFPVCTSTNISLRGTGIVTLVTTIRLPSGDQVASGFGPGAISLGVPPSAQAYRAGRCSSPADPKR